MSTLAPVTADDVDRLVDFLSSFPNERRPPDFWHERLGVWWDRNPAYEPELPRGTLLCEGARVVGFGGVIPSKFQLDGEPIVVFGGTTWRVLPDFRRWSLRLLSACRDQIKSSVVFATTASERALRVYDSWVLRSKVCVLPVGDVVCSVLPSSPEHSDVSGITLLSEDDTVVLDALWTTTREQFRNTVVRSGAAVLWYCFALSRQQKRLLGAWSERGLCGFAVGERVDRSDSSTWMMRDLWCDLNDTATIDLLLGGARRDASTIGCDAVYCPPIDPRVTAGFRRLGAVQQLAEPTKHRLYAPPAVRDQLRDGSTYLTDFLGDCGL